MLAEAPRQEQIRSIHMPTGETAKLIQGDVQEVEKFTQWFAKEANVAAEKLYINKLNPVLDRVGWLRFLRSKPTADQIALYKDYMLYGQIQTALRERNYAAQSVINYVERDGKIYNDRLPDEPFENILLRGLEYAKEHNTPEPERDEADCLSWINTVNFLKDPNIPIGTKVAVISGPGVAPGTHHGDNFVDIYEKVKDPTTGKWAIRATRNSSGLNYDQYKQIALEKNPHYFDGFEGPLDAWFVKHGLVYSDERSSNEVFSQEFGLRKGAMSEEEFQQRFQRCLPVGRYYVDKLCADICSPQDIVKGLHALLVENDQPLEETQAQFNAEYHDRVSKTPTLAQQTFKNVEDRVAWLLTQPVVAKIAACGKSESLFGGKSVFKTSFSASGSLFSQPGFLAYAGVQNSVGMFGLNKEQEWFECGNCDFKADRPLKDYGDPNRCPGCKITKEQWAAKGNAVC